MKSEMSCRCRVDRVFYLIGLILFIPVSVFGIWFAWGSGFHEYGELFACTFRQVTGLPCPGCGGTRAFYYLFRGEVFKSLQMNVTVIYGVLAYFHFMGLYLYRRYRKRDLYKEIQIQYYLYGTAVVVLGQWMLKLIIIFT